MVAQTQGPGKEWLQSFSRWHLKGVGRYYVMVLGNLEVVL